MLLILNRHHHNGRWEARIGRVCGNKYLYLGTYSKILICHLYIFLIKFVLNSMKDLLIVLYN